jgi:hypothetical protein
LYNIFITFYIYFSLLRTLIVFQNAKALLMWSVYVILVVLQSLATTLERDPRF